LLIIIVIQLYLIRSLFTSYSLIQSLHKLGYDLPIQMFLDSGKFKELSEILINLKESGHRVLIFSQFLSILDLLEIYMSHYGHSYLRLDGSTQVQERYEKMIIYILNVVNNVFILFILFVGCVDN